MSIISTNYSKIHKFYFLILCNLYSITRYVSLQEFFYSTLIVAWAQNADKLDLPSSCMNQLP